MKFTELTEEEAQAILEERIESSAVPDVDDAPFRPSKADPISRRSKRPMQGFRQSKARRILTREEALTVLNGFA